MSAPTLINLPPPPSDPVTPSGPGTPNSTTTSLSALSTTAIKDGHQGQPLHHAHSHFQPPGSMSSSTTLDAERADRISRLAGLERVATARAGGTPQPTFPFAYPPGYFDGSSGIKERSTVGSASATGSIGARTTWASGSDAFDVDKMSEGPDDGVSSVDNISDEGDASLVAFGEGSSTISGPSSHHPGLRVSPYGRPGSFGSPSRSRNPFTSPSHLGSSDESTPSTVVHNIPTTSTTSDQSQDTCLRNPLYQPSSDNASSESSQNTGLRNPLNQHPISNPLYQPSILTTSGETTSELSQDTSLLNPLYQHSDDARPSELTILEQNQHTHLRNPLHRPSDTSTSNSTSSGSTISSNQDARMLDGMTYDPDVVDTTVRTPRLATPNQTGGD